MNFTELSSRSTPACAATTIVLQPIAGTAPELVEGFSIRQS